MAAYLKFAAISIIAAALLAAACSESGGSAEPTPSPSTTASPPTAQPTATSQPTATPISPGVTSPSSTQGWLTYTSPFGFSFDYPENWTFEESLTACCPAPFYVPGTTVEVWNPIHQAARVAAAEPRGGLGGDFFIPPRSTIFRFKLLPVINGATFNTESLVDRCETEYQGGTAEVTEFHGHRAVVCRGTEIFQGRSLSYSLRSIELAGERVLSVSPILIEPSALEESHVDAILASLRFEDAPCDFADPGDLRRATSFNISGLDAYDTLVCGYLRLVDVPANSNIGAATLAYFVIIDHANAEFIQVVDDLIQRGNTLNRMVDGRREFRLGCFIDGAVRGSAVDSLTLGRLLDSSETNQVRLMLSFEEGGGVGGRCLSHANRVQLR